MSDARHTASERGFTLIELVVMMIILGVIMMMVTRILTSSLSGASETEQSRRTFVMTDQLRSRLEADLRSAIAPARFYNTVPSLDDLRQKVQTGSNNTIDSRGLVVDELIEATPTRLVFIGDGRAETGPTQELECITWWYDYAPSNRTWAIRRSIYDLPADGSCSARTGGAYIVGPMNATERTPSSLFGYVLTCQPGACSGNVSCEGRQVTRQTLNGRERRWVTQVLLDLDAFAIGDDAVKRADQVSAVALRSRTSDDYRYALGCGA